MLKHNTLTVHIPVKLSHLTLAGLICYVSLLVCMTAIITPHWIFAWLACIGYMALCGYVMHVTPAIFVLLLWFLFARLTTMVSGIAIESGGYMSEILRQGEASGAFTHIFAIYTFGIIALTALMQSGINLIPKANPQTFPARAQHGQIWIIGIMALITLLLSLACFIGVKHGFPLLTGADRIYYWRQVDNRFLYFFLGNRAIFALLLGVIYAISRGAIRYTGLGLFITTLLVSFLFAEKFTSISILLFAFVTPVFLLDQEKLRSLSKRIILLGIVLAALTTPVILTVYGVFDDPKSAISRLQTRATAQAQLWYVADHDQRELLHWDAPRIDHNMTAILAKDGGKIANTPPFLGAKDFMDATMEPSRYQHYRDRGITFTMATEAYLLKLFGYVGMVPFYLVILGVYAAYLLYLYYAIQCLDPIRMIIAAKLLVWANFALNQGYIWNLIGLKPFMLIVMIICYESVARVVFKNKYNTDRIEI